MDCRLLLLVFSLGSAILTFSIIYILKPNQSKLNFNRVTWIVFISGFIEILLYSGSIYTNKPEFIVYWLAFKTALKISNKIYNEDKKPKSNDDISNINNINRGIYHTFLLGTGLNILFGYISACLSKGLLIQF